MLPKPGNPLSHLPTDGLPDPSRRRLLQGVIASSSGLLLLPPWAQAASTTLAPFAPAAGSGTEEDAWHSLREALLASLNLVPVVGGFLSYIGGLFIPGAGQTPEHLWRAYTDGRISETLFRVVKADLEGLTKVSGLYRDAIAAMDARVILAQSVAANTAFVAALPRFQLPGERGPLLPLHAIAATLHLALLRDMILGAESIGITPAYREQLISQQQSAIREYTAYVDREVASVYDAIRRKPGSGPAANTPLSQLLQRRTRLYLEVIDLRDTWYAFDAAKHPGKVRVILNRELFTEVIGRLDDNESGRDTFFDWQPPLAPLRSLLVTRRPVSTVDVAFLDGVRMEYTDGAVLETGQLAQAGPPFVLEDGESITAATTRFRTIQGLVSITLVTSRNRRYKVEGQENSFDVVQPSQQDRHQLSSIRAIGRGKASAKAATGAYVLGFQLTNRTASRLSTPVLQRIVPGIAPNLLDWITG